MSEENSWYWKPIEQALADIDRADAGRPRKHFVILGAGIAGIAAAWELLKRHHTVEIIEGSDHPGGRVSTHHFKNGAYGERGAMRVPLAHDYTHHYLREAEIPQTDLRRFWNSRGNGFLDVRGVTVRESEFLEILPRFPGLTAEELAILRDPTPGQGGLGGLLGRAMGPLFTRLRPKYAALLAGNFSDPELAALDRMSWRQYLETTSLSPDARALLGAALTLAAVWDWSMAAILRDEIHQMHPRGQGYTGVLCELAGGLDRLPRQLADRLPEGTIRYNTRVLDIRPRGTGGGIVVLQNAQSGGSEETGFERLLCTLPFPVMRNMELPGFSPAKLAAIRGFRYASSTKVLLNYDERWWERDLGLRGGRSLSDRAEGKVTVPRQTYYSSDSVPARCGPDVVSEGVTLKSATGGDDLAGLFNQYVGETSPEPMLRKAAADPEAAARPGTLLAAYTLNVGARELCQSGTAVERVITEMEAIHGTPAPRRELKESLVWCWDKYEWAKGALAITPPNDLANHFQAAKDPQGVVHFAGEHVSIAPGWIQGSLESSLREVARMLQNT